MEIHEDVIPQGQTEAVPSMARPQTNGGIESSGQGGQRSCRMEALRPDGWRRGSVYSLPPGYQPFPLRPDAATHGTSSVTPCCLRTESGPSATSLAPTDSAIGGGEDSPTEPGNSTERPSDRQAPHTWGHCPLGEPLENNLDPEWEDEVSGRVADQLRIIGDEMNTMLLQRRNAVQPWQNWGGLCRGLFIFITDTLCTLYQHRHR